ncbi:methyltransferase domain-containing protein [Streptacidiphilus sp. ASG 303]|uniref:class I SAM-dependent methyltransferase n=1 Tax=Streptacidiphilus sp. ASG 303 TaxID=2896847 RepID=UPI001E5F336F|nr:class I SAM-dependent methyltransferase [Streptacidiphilus sp. ASG 303]MCD0482392.1 methyltransferase domain-containing protein [Streptacidiphilus sp. ASG 303]
MDQRDWDARYAAADLVWGAEPNRWVVRETAGLPPGRALDLAAGEGRNSIALAAAGWQVTAVDLSPVALDRGRRLAAAQPPGTADRITWVHADATAYTPEPAGYDLVILCFLHLPAADRRTVLDHAARALAPGGTLLVIGHDTSNLTEGVGGPQDPAVLFTPDDVLADLAGAGLEAVRAERLRRPVAPGHARGQDQGGGPAAEAVDALVRLRRP